MPIANVNGIRMYYRQHGHGPLLVLLHGWPQTGHCWRHLVGPLSQAYTVVVPDLRGYGRSDLPRDGHDKRTKAEDLHQLIRALGHERATVIGHDRGARVAHRWALDHPGDIDRLVVMDIIPTREMWRRMDADLARDTWHWLFHLQPDLPELLAGANTGAYLRHLIDAWSYVPLPEEDIAEYVRAFERPGALRAGFEDYRAAADAEHDEADHGRKIAHAAAGPVGRAQLPPVDRRAGGLARLRRGRHRHDDRGLRPLPGRGAAGGRTRTAARLPRPGVTQGSADRTVDVLDLRRAGLGRGDPRAGDRGVQDALLLPGVARRP